MSAKDETILSVPCPDCGELNPQPLEDVANNDVIMCSICGGLIDLSAEACRPMVEQARRSVSSR